jgi:hypothetical protein
MGADHSGVGCDRGSGLCRSAHRRTGRSLNRLPTDDRCGHARPLGG